MKYKISIVNCQLSIIIILFFALPTKAQVTIGKDAIPHSFSLLELRADKAEGGLRLPQLTTDQITAIKATLLGNSNDALEAKGLVVCDITLDCMNFWNGATWISLCSNVLPPIQITGYGAIVPTSTPKYLNQDSTFHVNVTGMGSMLIYEWYYTGIFHNVDQAFFPHGTNGSGYTDTAVLLSQNSGNSITIHKTTDQFLINSNMNSAQAIFVKVYYKGDEAHAIYSDIWLLSSSPTSPS